MATRLQFENSNEIGVFARLTNRFVCVCMCVIVLGWLDMSAAPRSDLFPLPLPLLLLLSRSYCLTALGGSENFYSVFEQELADHIPVIHASVAGCRFIGRVTVGAFVVIVRGQGRVMGQHIAAWTRRRAERV